MLQRIHAVCSPPMASTTEQTKMPTPSSSTSSSAPKHDEASEITKLRAQNAKLAKLVDQLQAQHGSSMKPLSPHTVVQAEHFYTQLQRKIEQGAVTNSTSNTPTNKSEHKHDDDAAGGGERLPTRASPFYASGVTDKPAKSAIFVCKNGSLNTHADEDEEFDMEDKAYVCVMDVPDEEWWEIIEPEVEDVEPIVSEPSFDSDKSYEIIDDVEVTEALSAFITSTIQSHPEAFSLSDLEMKKMLDGTFVTLREKGSVGRALEYGTLAYSAYGWGSYAWQIYSKPGMAKFVLKGAYTAGSWLIYLCI